MAGTSFERQYSEARKLEVNRALKDLLIHAYNNVSYYGNILREAGVVKNHNVCLANFRNIPILTKEIIRRRAGELVSRDFETRKWVYNTSGGSTGEPVKLIQDRIFQKWVQATSRFYYRDIVGVDETFAKKVILWGARRDIYGSARATIEHALTNTVVLNSYSMTEADMRRFIGIINSYKPEIVRGYASSLYELCRFARKRKLSIFSPKVVVSAAETLSETMKKEMESVFGTKVYNFYGSREVGAIAGECRYGLLHIFMFNNYLEVLDRNNQKVKEGESGRVVVTTVHNFSMPLIRYHIGDVAILGPKECRCGNPLPTLRKVKGRRIDYFTTEDARKIYGGYFVRLLWDKDWIRAFKVVQEDYKRLRILVALRNGIIDKNDKREIEEKIRLIMGENCDLIWEVVDEIPKTDTGKYLYLQSLLEE